MTRQVVVAGAQVASMHASRSMAGLGRADAHGCHAHAHVRQDEAYGHPRRRAGGGMCRKRECRIGHWRAQTNQSVWEMSMCRGIRVNGESGGDASGSKCGNSFAGVQGHASAWCASASLPRAP